jgi:CDP-glycerol glycerophosphotransferase
MERLIPRDKNIWIFGSMGGSGYSDNSKVFFEYMLLHHPEITAVWITGSKTIYTMLRSRKIAVYTRFSIKGILYSLRAKYFISDHTNGDLNIYTGNGAKKIYLWHGMPLKAMGYFCDEYLKGRRSVLALKWKLEYFLCPYLRNNDIDLLIVSSDFFKPFLASSFSTIFGKKLPLNRLVTTGLPRNDRLFSGKAQPLLERLRKKYKNCRVLFYMPTFRLGIYNKIPFTPFSGYQFEEPVFNAFLEEENIVFLFKPHFFDKNLPDFSLSGRFLYLKGDEYDDLYEFLGQIDIMITDYSSVYFDFLLTNKPVILTPFDYDEYKKMRGLFFDYNTYMRGAKAYNWNDLIQIVKERKYYAVNDHNVFNYYTDGGSCGRVFNAIIAG